MSHASFDRWRSRAFPWALAILALAAWAPAAGLYAQQGAVAGTVRDADAAAPVADAQVFVPGTSIGVLTDQEGRYRLEGLPAGPVEIRVQVIGYRPASRTVEVVAGQVVTADFELAVSAIQLEGLVATITGQERRRELGYSATTIAAGETQEKRKNLQLLDLLQGQSTGVTVRRSTGTLGTGSDVRIRGTGSIGLSNTPLIVVDGTIIDNDNAELDDAGVFPDIFTGGQTATRLNDIDPDEIESVEVIKGPAAAALYGARGNAGVILITTKQGQAGDVSYRFRGEVGANWNVSEFPTTGVNPQSLLGPAAVDTVYTMNLLEEFGDDALRTGVMQTYGGDISGGSDLFRYFVSGEYNDQDGSWVNNQLTKFNVRGNFSFSPSDKVDISVSNGYVSSFLDLPDNDNNIFGFIGVALVGFPWNQSITRADPNTGGDPIETCPLGFEIARTFGLSLTAANGFCGENAFFSGRTFSEVATIRTEQDVERYTGSAIMTWRPTDFWDWRITAGYDQVNDRQNKTFPADPALPHSTLSLGDISRVSQTNRNLTLQATTTFRYGLGQDFALETTAGGQFFLEKQETVLAKGQIFPAGAPTIGNSLNNQSNDEFDEQRSLGVIFQQQIGFRDRIFLTPGVRLDDNSATGQDLGVQTYPKVGLSWVVSDEPGFPDLFSSLKLRAAWGQSGSLPLTNAARAILAAQKATFRQTDVLGITRVQPSNEELKPERAEEIEFGFDAGLLRERLALSLTYYNQRTKDAIVATDLAPSIGFPDEQFTNIGSIRNRGIEAQVDAALLEMDDVRWSWGLNVSTNSNEITQLDQPIIFGLGVDSQAHREGLPFGSYQSERFVIGEDGEARALTCDEVAGTWGPGDTPGSPRDFCDPVTNKFFAGNPTPEWQGSVSSTLRLFDHITVYGLVDFQGGHQLFNSTEQFHCGFLGGGKPAETGGGIALSCLETGPDGEFTDEAKIKQLAGFFDEESPFVYDADWAKLRTVSVRFDVPSAWLRSGNLPVKGLSLTLAGENLATWTGYGDDLSPGVDPEINFAGQFEAIRAEFLTQAPARRVVGTLNVTF